MASGAPMSARANQPTTCAASSVPGPPGLEQDPDAARPRRRAESEVDRSDRDEQPADRLPRTARLRIRAPMTALPRAAAVVMSGQPCARRPSSVDSSELRPRASIDRVGDRSDADVRPDQRPRLAGPAVTQPTARGDVRQGNHARRPAFPPPGAARQTRAGRRASRCGRACWPDRLRLGPHDRGVDAGRRRRTPRAQAGRRRREG